MFRGLLLGLALASSLAATAPAAAESPDATVMDGRDGDGVAWNWCHTEQSSIQHKFDMSYTSNTYNTGYAVLHRNSHTSWELWVCDSTRNTNRAVYGAYLDLEGTADRQHYPPEGECQAFDVGWPIRKWRGQFALGTGVYATNWYIPPQG
jgi:hypothetical protein